MKKRIISLMCAAAFGAFVLTGCGSDPNEVRYALVTGPDGAEGSSELKEIRSGIESYTSANAMVAKAYAATSKSNSGYAEAFKATNADKARYVIACGEEMEVPVYEAQNAYHDRKFILLDGEPRKNPEVESSIRKNTECITFDKATVGFLAGYASVKMGHTSIAWMTGPSTEARELYYEGFLNGAAHAASEMGISSASLTVTAVRSASEAFSPGRYAEARELYNEGCGVILTDSEELARACIIAADDTGGSVATVGFDYSAKSDRVIFSSVPNYAGVITSLMEAFDNREGFDGGTKLVCTAKQNCVKLAGEYSRMPNYTEADTQKIIAAMAAGTAVVTDTPGEGDAVGTVGLGYTLNVQVRGGASGSEVTGES